MNLLDKLALALRSAATDLAGRGPGLSGRLSTEALIRSAQKRIDRLSEHLARAIEREKRAEREWQQALSEAAALDLEAQLAAQTALDEAAKVAALAKQNQARQAHDKARQLEAAYHEAASFAEKLRIQIGDTQAQLERARKLTGQPSPQSAPPVAETQPEATQAEATQAPVRQPAAQNQPAAKQASRPADAPAPADEPLDQTRIADILSKRKGDG